MTETLTFDGATSWIEVPGLASPTKDSGGITVEFWNKVDQARDSFAFAFDTAEAGARISCHAPWSDGRD